VLVKLPPPNIGLEQYRKLLWDEQDGRPKEGVKKGTLTEFGLLAYLYLESDKESKLPERWMKSVIETAIEGKFKPFESFVVERLACACGPSLV